MIIYQHTLEHVSADHLHGFFVGWPNPPSPQTLFRLLGHSSHIWLAREEETRRVVGFINALSDGVLSAYIPLLEVLPAFQGRGIGKELTRRMLTTLQEYYMVDLLCDADLQPFYAGLGMRPAKGAMLRHYDKQQGKAAPEA